ncbi:unnamed protein product [Echinostoma caproni]|uniref:Ovate family protein n=1 Tax=Echinostoma caproni TaxID=27848 RepID=A0A183AHD9_9TREM|nr:unnamed protein product [Echinostoma caproni]
MGEKKLQFQDNFEIMMKRGSSFIQNMDNKRREFVDHLEYISHDIVRSFMRIFGADGRLRSWFSNRRHALTDSEDHSSMSSPGSTDSQSSDSKDRERRWTISGMDDCPTNKLSRKRNASVAMLNEFDYHHPDDRTVSTSGSTADLTIEDEDAVASDPGLNSYNRPMRTRRSLNSYRSPVLSSKLRKFSA